MNTKKKSISKFLKTYKVQVVMIAFIIMLLPVLVVLVGKLSGDKKKENIQIAAIKEELLNNKKEKTELEKAREKNYTDAYKEYEKLTDEEKKEIEVVPKKDEIPFDDLDDIIDDQPSTTIPSKFNLADKLKINVEDQENYGLCWDFAATKSLETYLQIHNNTVYDLAEIHVDYITSNLMYGWRNIHDGGNFSDFEDYLRVSGPVLQMEYRDYTEEEYMKFNEMEPVATVTNTVNFPSIVKKSTEYEESNTKEEIEKFRKAVKNHIMTNGSLYAVVSAPDFLKKTKDGNTFYCEDGRCYRGLHAVSIVGWDDNFSKNNFVSENGNKPKEDGAYLALNSWGDLWGDNGYFYVSYEDYEIETWLSGVGVSYTENQEDQEDQEDIKKAYKVNEIENSLIKKIIIDELGYSFINKDGESYVTKLALENLYSLDLANMNVQDSDLEELEIFPNLSYLKLSNNNITDVSRLSNLDLYYLDISGNKNVIGYDKLSNISFLNLSDCNITQLLDLKNLKDLYSLNLSNNINIKFEDMLPIGLGVLNLSGNSLTNLPSLSKYEYLCSIILNDNSLTSLKGLDNSEIVRIEVSGNKITDYTALKTLSGVWLTANNNDISDISIFNEYDIEMLNLSENKITDISKFDNQNLYYLDLSKNNVSTGFKSLKNLPLLSLESNNLTDISELSELKEIQNLYLSNNKIEDVTPLNNLKNLVVLDISYNKQLTNKPLINNHIDTLNVSDCNLDNSFDFSQLKNLVVLDISDNSNYTDVVKTISEIVSSADTDSYISVYMDNMHLTSDDIEKIEALSRESYFNIGGSIITLDTTVQDSYLVIEHNWIKKMIMKNTLYGGLSVENATIDTKKLTIKAINLDIPQVTFENANFNSFNSAKLIIKY